MNKKLREALSQKCKDMGLTSQAIDRLAELGGEGLAEDASDEDINAKVDMLVPFAKAMQGEVTRKTSSTKGQSTKEQSTDKGEGNGEGKGEGEKKEDEVPSWAKQLQQDVAALRQENADLKAAKAKADRATLIADKAKKLGIPDYLMKRVAIADDADIDKELTEYKQELVNNGLSPKEQGIEPGSSQKSLEAEADAWIKATYGV